MPHPSSPHGPTNTYCARSRFGCDARMSLDLGSSWARVERVALQAARSSAVTRWSLCVCRLRLSPNPDCSSCLLRVF